MGQLFLDILGKRGMLAIWSLIIVVQYVTGAAQGVDASRVVFAFARDNTLHASWLAVVEEDASVHPRERGVVRDRLLGFLDTALARWVPSVEFSTELKPLGIVMVAWVNFITSTVLLMFPQ